jgi:hypothetical protein
MKNELNCVEDVSNFELDEFHYHEITDRLYTIMVMIDNLLISHPTTLQHNNLKKKITDAHDNIFDAYQISGDLSSNNIKNELI